MKKLVIGIIAWIMVAAIIGISLIGFALFPADREKAKIGVIGPLSGDVASLFEGVKNGALLALKDSGADIEFVFEDGKCSGRDAITAAKKLIEIDRVEAILGGLCSGETLAIAPVADSEEVALVSAGSTNPTISGISEYVFRTIPHDAVQGKTLAEAVYNLKYRKPAIIFINNDYGSALKDVIANRLGELNIEALAVEAFEQDAMDFRTQLLKIQSKNPDSLIIVSLAKEPPIILKQAKELGMELQFFGPETFADNDVIQNSGNAINGTIFTYPHVSTTSIAQDFREKYKKEYGRDTDAYAAEAYDAATILINAIKAGNTTGPQIKNYLNSINLEGASGTIQFDPNGDVQKEYDLYIIEDGAYKPYPQ